MSKYHLVASYYNLYQKKYENEIEVTIPGIDLSTIQAIDYYTSSHTNQEILSKIEQVTGIKGLNHLSIKYYKNKTAKPIYYHIIEYFPEFTPCTKSTITKQYKLLGKLMVTSVVLNDIELFQKEKSELLQIIEKRNLEAFEKRYPYNDQFYFLVTRIITSSYDEQQEMQNDLNQAMLELSRYKTFRGWIVAKQKEKKYQPITRKDNTLQKEKKEPITVKSISEYEEEYTKIYEEKNKQSYQKNFAYQYNTSHLDEDAEEFLEIDEMDQICGIYPEYDSSTPKVKARHKRKD